MPSWFLLKKASLFQHLEELDIFKLDIIARELKALDNEVGLVGKEAETHGEDCEL